MTILNVLLETDRATIYTDTLVKTVPVPGSSHSASQFHMTKCQTLPHMNLAVGARGKLAIIASVCRLLSANAHDFDTARKWCSDELHAASRIFYEDISERDAWSSKFDLAVAGWSGDAPRAFMIGSHDGSIGGPWVVSDVDYLATAPYIEAPVTIATYDPVRKMAALMRSQMDLEPNAFGGKIVETIVFKGYIHQVCRGEINSRRPIQAAESTGGGHMATTVRAGVIDEPSIKVPLAG